MITNLLYLSVIWNISATSGDLLSVLEDLEELEIGQPYRLDNGLEITSVKKPRSCFKKASEGDIVVLHYVGRTRGPRGEIFDESRPKGFPYKFEVGGGRAIL